MKPALTVILIFASVCALAAQSSPPSPNSGLGPVLTRIQEAAQATNDDLSRLRIDKWKTESDQKAEMTKLAESVHRNLTYAVPDLIKGVQSSKGSVSATFKLYHNINVLYEYLNVLAESAGNFGRSDEYTPLSQDASTLDAVRQDLSSYIEQAAATLEVKAATPVATPAPPPPPKKIVVDETPVKAATPRKKKTSTPPPQASPTPN